MSDPEKLTADWVESWEKLLAQNLPFKVFLKSRDLTYLACNENYAIDHGLKTSEILGRSDYDLYPRELAEKYRAEDLRILETGQSETIEGRFVKDRQELHSQTIKSLFRNPSGEVIGILGTFWDITERKRAEEALRESEEKYRSVFNSFVDLYYQTDMQGLITNLSPSCFMLSGWKPEELIGHQVLEFYPNPEQRKALLEKLRLEGAVSDYEITLLHRDRRCLSVSVSSHLIKDEHGNPKYVEGTMRDITERKRAEEALRQSEERFRATINASPDGFAVMDLAGKLEMVSPALLAMRGCEREEEMVGHSNLEFFPPEDWDHAKSYVTLIQQGEAPGPSEFRAIRVDGSLMDIETNGVLIRGVEGQPTGIFFVVRDITERKRAEEALRESERKLKTIFDLLPMGVAVLDNERKIVYENPALRKIIQMDREDLHREKYKMRMYTHSDGTPMSADEYASIRATREQKAIHNVETGIVLEDGKLIWTDVSAVPVALPDWKMVILTVDITERKRAEDALRESKERLELALIGGNLGFYDLDLQTGEGYTDERYLGMLGYAPGEIDLGSRANWEQQVHPDDLRFANHLVRSAIQGEMPVYDEEYRMRHKSGEWVWVRDHSRVTACSADGRPLRVTGIHENVTERKRSEVALRESEERFRRIFQSATDCIFIKNRSLQYIEVNPAMEKLLNGSSGLLVGKNSEDLFGPEAVKLVEADRRALVGETVESEDVLWVQGIPYTFLTVKMPLRDNTGSIVGVIGIARDISERARAERELNRNREQLEEMVRDRTVALEQTNLALKTLTQKLVETQETERREIARELHDDIGQELTGLKLLLERSYRKAPPELKVSFKGADGLVSGILTKIRDMALNLRPSMLDDLGLLPALLYQFERFSTHTHIETRFQHIGLETRFPPEIETAAFRIIQEALTNVARHAKTSEVWITVENQGEDLWLTVTDQGVGFDPERGLAGGNSTGLKGIRERVSAIGGSFILESIPGSGSLLKVQLPLREKKLDLST